ncbi:MULTISPECIES: 2,3-bisphosphoglycerate-independent phosphoglycerate mutase [Candidatus Neomicrothrix]|jgi:2,3-bisphosphoglycerate-independent phosphoglycerate mutase|uniref:2,3-bisphosphoglycerate-independent phosphoglycerate mutase n=1 Tax=Candidatus Neomicrothrix parvicella RN1 TaxID=1229780 RepID=R4YZI6_9ACTN|nr:MULTISPECIES: 2,3-bisphosphoglycerate-independent phosphoglycerate mutase [Microthrix]NLH67447.1 2,3-bisphosphoglycerate-independent phosphoglycerate mutase [Candidatus Microthrix parvicella]MBK6501765.1 2,3-bisphosphoglycerate-independent phosphoglycerate mutase [Candidatus Microthrix sp.]MBK7018954.1 2,3-bisphosphoglycerate-independent phosphoglycerate mutase [Candidatus Microthrix sp.]MBL0203318.1 2,3-bisphosphoglycerate-independent phosphoglycerate mutase [Candidatus Microthrix sp.]MBP6
MSLSLSKHPSFSGRPGPVLVVVADGVGVAPPGASNAVTEAVTPTLDALTSSELYTELAAHGPAVGLPTEDDMGNSEVGHNALGAGRIFAQGAKLVNQALANDTIFQTEVWKTAVEHGREGTLHLIGLHSDGGVHSTNAQLYQLLWRAADDGVTSCAVHILHDGRDVAARSALAYIAVTEAVLAEINAVEANAAGAQRDFRIASGGGRMRITMDRYGADWPMVERGYRTHVFGEGRRFASATDAVETMYAETDKGDQYLGEFVIERDLGAGGEPAGTIVDGDAVIFFNFRGDRAIEISQALADDHFDQFDRTGPAGEPRPSVFYAGMLQYDGDLQVPTNYLVNPPAIDRTMGEFLCAEGVASFAISETQKFGHVTYFWNGNKSGYIDEELETYIEIPSDNVEFDTTPAMKVREITAETIDLLRSGEYRFGRLNFPSGDMVGHTGHLPATVEAVEIIDEHMAKLVEVIDELGGVLIYTADHGNADIMFTEEQGVRSPKTSHTLSPVPFAIHDPNYDGEYQMVAAAPGPAHGLANVAATVFDLLGYEAPADYLPSLIGF